MDAQDKLIRIRRLIDNLKSSDAANPAVAELFSAVADMFEELQGNMQMLWNEIEENTNLIDELDSDLSDLEDVIYGEDTEAEFDENDWKNIEFEVVCPQCSEKNIITLDVDPEAVVCPKCGFEYNCIDQLEAIEEEGEEEPEI